MYEDQAANCFGFTYKAVLANSGAQKVLTGKAVDLCDLVESNNCTESEAYKNLKSQRNNCLGYMCRYHVIICHHSTWNWVFDILDAELSGMLNLCLSVKFGAHMKKFRSCLVDVITERLVIHEGLPAADAILHRHKILRLYLSRGKNATTKRCILRLVPNGDWRNHKQVEFWVPVGQKASTRRYVIVSRMATGLMCSLCSSHFHAF